jgi:hypothetical protein
LGGGACDALGGGLNSMLLSLSDSSLSELSNFPFYFFFYAAGAYFYAGA